MACLNMQRVLLLSASEMYKNPEQDWQSYGGGQAGGEESSRVCHIQKCHDQSDHVHGNEQNDTYQCGDLLRRHFSFIDICIFVFI